MVQPVLVLVLPGVLVGRHEVLEALVQFAVDGLLLWVDPPLAHRLDQVHMVPFAQNTMVCCWLLLIVPAESGLADCFRCPKEALTAPVPLRYKRPASSAPTAES